MTFKRRTSRYLEGSNQKYQKSDDDDNNSEGTITLIHDFVNKR
jgi:hypothetical protein